MQVLCTFNDNSKKVYVFCKELLIPTPKRKKRRKEKEIRILLTNKKSMKFHKINSPNETIEFLVFNFDGQSSALVINENKIISSFSLEYIKDSILGKNGEEKQYELIEKQIIFHFNLITQLLVMVIHHN